MGPSGPTWAAFLFYAAATFAALGYLRTRDARASRAMLGLLALGVACHLAGFGALLKLFWAHPENRWYLPITSFFGALSFISLALALAFLAVEGSHRLGVLGAFVLPWCAAAAGAAVALSEPVLAPLDPRLRSYWLNIHPVLLMAAYAVMANAFGVGLAFLIQERQIKSRKPTELCYRLPSLDELDRLVGRIVAIALPVLVLGLLVGMVWSSQQWGRAWSWEPKQTLGALTALLYASYLWMRHVRGLRGPKPVLVSMAGFACVLATLFGAELFSGRHGYLAGGAP